MATKIIIIVIYNTCISNLAGEVQIIVGGRRMGTECNFTGSTCPWLDVTVSRLH